MSIVTLTEKAIQHIRKILSDKPTGAAFRLSVKQTGCSGYMYQPEVVTSKKENDIAMPIADFTVYIDPACVTLIQGTTIDYVKKKLGQSQLEFNNPNADSLCGCGESFNLKGALPSEAKR